MNIAAMVSAVEQITARHITLLDAQDATTLAYAAEGFRGAVGQLKEWNDEAREHVAALVTRTTFQSASTFADLARGHVAAELSPIASEARRRANAVSMFKPDRVALRGLADGLVLRLDAAVSGSKDVGATLALEAHQVERIVGTESFAAYNGTRALAIELLAQRGDGDTYVIPTSLDGFRDASDWVPGILKRWNASLDSRTCPRCSRLRGDVRILGMAFDGEPNPPLHARCRCFVAFFPIAVPKRK